MLRLLTSKVGTGLAAGGAMVAACGAGSRVAELEGSDPLDCAEPVCEDKVDMLMSSFGKTGKKGGAPKKECPLSRSQLGRSTWEFLHTTAAYYPQNPTPDQQKAANDLLHSIGELYPCKHCREHYANHLEAHPADVSSRESFETWLCDTHNIVNEVLDKPQFDCAKLEERWRTGCRQKH